jgi:hypothetical protein
MLMFSPLKGMNPTLQIHKLLTPIHFNDEIINLTLKLFSHQRMQIQHLTYAFKLLLS